MRRIVNCLAVIFVDVLAAGDGGRVDVRVLTAV